MNRATQLANQRAANAARIAGELARRKPKPAPRTGGRQMPGGGEGLVAPRPSRPLPPPPKMGPVKKRPRSDEALGLIPGAHRPDLMSLEALQGPGMPRMGGVPEILAPLLDPVNTPDTTTPQLIDEKTGKPGAILPGTAGPGYVGLADWQGRAPTEVNRFADMTPEQQKQVRKNFKETQGEGKVAKTIKQMVEDIRKDPIQDSNRFLAGQELAEAFRDESQAKYFTNQDLTENPLLATLNELSVWSTYRLKLAEWNANKKKTGTTPGLVGAEDGEEGGDGTFTGIVDNGSFASVTTASNLSPYLVTRDENGLLQVVTADQWIQGKFAQMRHDPEYAANMITALAMTSAYGSDSTANSQRSRIVTDAEGNPVKAFVSSEDLAALKQLANQVAILQNQGDEVAIDDSIAELTAMAADVTETAAANGDFGGGGGGYGYGGGGGGYGGGGGGGGAVRYTDATQLTAQVGSIARQRMGRELTPEEAAQFVAYYHQLEEQSTAAYYAGQSNTQLDPEGQAVAWVTSHFGDESGANQYGNLAATFFQMMGTENPFGGIS
jgi:uncharacterized membrane protein YgcG